MKRTLRVSRVYKAVVPVPTVEFDQATRPDDTKECCLLLTAWCDEIAGIHHHPYATFRLRVGHAQRLDLRPVAVRFGRRVERREYPVERFVSGERHKVIEPVNTGVDDVPTCVLDLDELELAYFAPPRPSLFTTKVLAGRCSASLRAIMPLQKPAASI